MSRAEESTPRQPLTPEQVARVDELRCLDKITLASRLLRAEEALAMRSETGASDLAVQELENIFKAERFNRERFRDDTEFADWARSRCQFTLGRIKR